MRIPKKGEVWIDEEGFKCHVQGITEKGYGQPVVIFLSENWKFKERRWLLSSFIRDCKLSESEEIKSILNQYEA